MAFYLFRARYSKDAIKALLANPSDRAAAAAKVIEAAGGKMHHMFFALGDADVVVLLEMPDNASAAAVSMVTGAAGGIEGGSLTPLLTIDEAMQAMRKAGAITGSYKPPQG